jgi:signal transduction histidine kinase
LTIKDNEKGFDVNNFRAGNGLKNMKFRCAEAGGTFDLKSNNVGMEIICSFTKA